MGPLASSVIHIEDYWAEEGNRKTHFQLKHSALSPAKERMAHVRENRVRDYDPYNGGTTGGAAECRWKAGPQGRDGMVIPAERHIHGGVDYVRQRRQAS
uniref:Uncharacterized protein n=1 Tax=Oryza glumipatula TaxID=40148 RepID=A0A0E0AHM4_9ORYZ